MELKTILVTQARLGSTRLPGKVLKTIDDKSLLEIHLNRLSKASLVDKIIVATTNKEEDNIIFQNVIKWGFDVYRGSESDVLDRFYQAVKDLDAKWIVRVTSDCPLLDPILIDKVIEFAITNDKDYCSNVLIENFPDGQDIEIFKFSALKMAWENAVKISEREHVTPFIRNNSDFNGGNLFTAVNYPCNNDFSKIRMTVDEIKDFELMKYLIQSLGVNKTWEEYTKYILENGIGNINGSIQRNEGMLKSLKNDK